MLYFLQSFFLFFFVMLSRKRNSNFFHLWRDTLFNEALQKNHIKWFSDFCLLETECLGRMYSRANFGLLQSQRSFLLLKFNAYVVDEIQGILFGLTKPKFMAFLLCIQNFGWKPLDFRNQSFSVLSGKEPRISCICTDLQPVWNHTVISCCSGSINLNFPNKLLNPKTIWGNSIITYLKWDSENHFQMTFSIRSLLIAVTGTINISQIIRDLGSVQKSKIINPHK